MLKINLDLGELADWAKGLEQQIPFAVATALTATAKDVQQALSTEVDDAFEGGATRFTEQAFFAVPARKDRLVALVGVKDKQADYLAFQIAGGVRPPKRKALRLPGVTQLTPEGNLPSGLIAQLKRRAQADKRATKSQARRFGVSQQVSLFYGQPGDGRPGGVYKRVPVGAGKERLVPVVVFVQEPAQYEARFDFFGLAQRTAAKRWPVRLSEAWARAKATAR